MTRDHAAEQLLRLGSLTIGEFYAITGWPRAEADAVLRRMIERGVVVEQVVNEGGRRLWIREQLPGWLYVSPATGRVRQIDPRRPGSMR